MNWCLIVLALFTVVRATCANIFFNNLPNNRHIGKQLLIPDNTNNVRSHRNYVRSHANKQPARVLYNNLKTTILNNQFVQKNPSFLNLRQVRQPTINQKLNNFDGRQARNDGAYSWGYSWTDQFGTQLFREETADGMGTVWGRYSFREASGIIRIVEYVADQNGFRTRIRSNEPGLVSSNPANAEIIRFQDENNIPL